MKIKMLLLPLLCLVVGLCGCNSDSTQGTEQVTEQNTGNSNSATAYSATSQGDILFIKVISYSAGSYDDFKYYFALDKDGNIKKYDATEDNYYIGVAGFNKLIDILDDLGEESIVATVDKEQVSENYSKLQKADMDAKYTSIESTEDVVYTNNTYYAVTYSSGTAKSILCAKSGNTVTTSNDSTIVDIADWLEEVMPTEG